MNIENLKKVKQSIEADPRETLDLKHPNGVIDVVSLMSMVSHSKRPTCVAAHAFFLSRDWEGYPPNWSHWPCDMVETIAAEYLGIPRDRIKDLFTPITKSYHCLAQNDDPKFITKSHILKTLDRIVAGETDIDAAWEKGV